MSLHQPNYTPAQQLYRDRVLASRQRMEKAAVPDAALLEAQAEAVMRAGRNTAVLARPVVPGPKAPRRPKRVAPAFILVDGRWRVTDDTLHLLLASLVIPDGYTVDKGLFVLRDEAPDMRPDPFIAMMREACFRLGLDLQVVLTSDDDYAARLCLHLADRLALPLKLGDGGAA